MRDSTTCRMGHKPHTTKHCSSAYRFRAPMTERSGNLKKHCRQPAPYQNRTQTLEPLCPLSSVLGWTGTVGVGGEGLPAKTTHLARLLFATVLIIRQVKICAFQKTLRPAVPDSLALPSWPSAHQENPDGIRAACASPKPPFEPLRCRLRTWRQRLQQHRWHKPRAVAVIVPWCPGKTP
jgi:hypothetical protein